MTPKEKAKELVEKYLKYTWKNPQDLMFLDAKECALIYVDEMLNEIKTYMGSFRITREEYWQQVKQEIEKPIENDT